MPSQPVQLFSKLTHYIVRLKMWEVKRFVYTHATFCFDSWQCFMPCFASAICCQHGAHGSLCPVLDGMFAVCRLLVERILNIHLVPYTLPVADRMKKLLELYCTLDDNAVKWVPLSLCHLLAGLWYQRCAVNVVSRVWKNACKHVQGAASLA